MPGDGEALPRLGDGGAGPCPETAKLFRGSEMAELARDRRRWSWKGSETAELAQGSGMAELARARPGDGGSLPESGDSGSLLRLEDGGAGQSSEMAKLAGARDGGTGQGSETAELEKARRR